MGNRCLTFAAWGCAAITLLALAHGYRWLFVVALVSAMVLWMAGDLEGQS